MIKKFFIFLLIVLCLSCSATAKKRSFGEVIDDGVITNKLKAKYVKDKIVKAGHINIDTWKGVVSLKGSVDSQPQVDRAIELAEQQVGVKEVRSYLIVEDQVNPKGKSFIEKISGSSGSSKQGDVIEKDLTQKK